jgi:hypothetical protein
LTKIISAENIDFGKVEEFQPKTMSGKILNIGTERVAISGLVSNNPKFIADITEKLMEPEFPASSNIYFLNAKKTIQAATGVISTTDLGFGKAGTTDADGKFTFKPVMLALSLTGPAAGTKYELSESFNVAWTSSNITLVNVILESESGGYKKYSDVDATLGTLAVSISASDGFSINELVYVYIENTHQTIEDSLQVATVATVTMNAITGIVAGTPKAVTGTHNGGAGYFVQVQSRVSDPEGAWETFEDNVPVQADNTWTATGTIAAPGTRDFRGRDKDDPDGQIQLDDVVVASGEFVIDNFESYANGANLITSSAWISGTGSFTNAVTNTEFGVGTQSWNVKHSSSGSWINIQKTFTSDNYNGKSLKVYARIATANANNQFKIDFMTGAGTIRQSADIALGTNFLATWAEYTIPITYNGAIDRIAFKIFNNSTYNVYIDDIRIV